MLNYESQSVASAEMALLIHQRKRCKHSGRLGRIDATFLQSFVTAKHSSPF